MDKIQEQEMARYIEQTQNFVLWHYQFGSKYDTPFWDYAKTLTFKDDEFDSILNYSRKCDKYDILPSVNVYGGMTDNILYWTMALHIVLSDGMMG